MKKISYLLVLIVAVFAMTGCNEKKTFEALGGEWNVIAVGDMEVPDSVGAFIGFDLTENVVYGSTGCNQFSGVLPAAVNPMVPIFGTMGSTRRMCSDMAVEKALFSAFGQVVDFRVDGDELHLLDSSCNKIVFLHKR